MTNARALVFHEARVDAGSALSPNGTVRLLLPLLLLLLLLLLRRFFLLVFGRVRSVREHDMAAVPDVYCWILRLCHRDKVIA